MREKIKRFKRIQRVRELNRDLIQKKLLELKERETKLLNTLRIFRDQKEAYITVFHDVSTKGVSIDVIKRANEDIVRVEKNIKRGIIEVFKLRKKIETANSELIESHKEVKKIELHLENLGTQLDLDSKLEEQKVVDDIATILYSRKKGGPDEKRNS